MIERIYCFEQFFASKEKFYSEQWSMENPTCMAAVITRRGIEVDRERHSSQGIRGHGWRGTARRAAKPGKPIVGRNLLKVLTFYDLNLNTTLNAGG
jgi:hypothetical protein